MPTQTTRESFRKKLHKGEFDDTEIEIDVESAPSLPSFDLPGNWRSKCWHYEY